VESSAQNLSKQDASLGAVINNIVLDTPLYLTRRRGVVVRGYKRCPSGTVCSSALALRQAVLDGEWRGELS